MSQHRLNRIAAALSLAALLVACGGGDRPTAAAHPMANAAAVAVPGANLPGTEGRKRALDVQATIDATMLFVWIERAFPDLFPSGPQNFQLTADGMTYTLRYYPPPANNYAGVGSDGNVYGLGAFTNNDVKNFGPLSGFTCDVAPDLCAPPPPSGALNECIDPAAAALPTGFNVKLVYALSGLVNSEKSVELTVIGPATFEGQSAIQVNTVSQGSNTVAGYTVTTTSTIKSFQQVATGGLVKTLGSLDDAATSGITIGNVTTPGTLAQTKLVYTPAELNTEYTLQVGQSITKAGSLTTTTIAPAGVPPLTVPYSYTYAFEAKETITVLGKSYSTCRYRITSPEDTVGGLSWLMLGKSVPVKSQTTAEGVTQVIELKSGTYNGQPL